MMITVPSLRVVDSTGGAVSATRTIDDTTSSVKDDLATLAQQVNDLTEAVRQIAARLEELSHE